MSRSEDWLDRSDLCRLAGGGEQEARGRRRGEGIERNVDVGITYWMKAQAGWMETEAWRQYGMVGDDLDGCGWMDGGWSTRWGKTKAGRGDINSRGEVRKEGWRKCDKKGRWMVLLVVVGHQLCMDPRGQQSTRGAKTALPRACLCVATFGFTTRRQTGCRMNHRTICNVNENAVGSCVRVVFTSMTSSC